MNSEPTVILVDDDESVREALKFLIESVEIPVQTFGSANEFLEGFDPRTHGCLILDVRMPGMSGLELQENLAAYNCGLPVIIITGHADVQMCVRAFESGALAFLEKPVNQQDLLEQVHKAIELDAKNRRESATPAKIAERLARLTPREHDVMGLLLVGKSLKDISRTLKISLPTCSKHRANVLAKLDVNNDVQLVRCLHDWHATMK